jgi:hypothetical protein
MNSCIIIGNGPSVLDKKNRNQIESFDLIVRINNFITKGYEEYIGDRTDILFTCELKEYNSIERISGFREVIVSLLNDSSLIGPEILDSEKIKICLDWDFASIVGRAIGLTNDEYPSTGMIAIYYMIHVRKYKVTITGFDNFEGGRSAHYFEPDRQNYPSRHNGLKEKKYINKLIKNNKLQLI